MGDQVLNCKFSCLDAVMNADNVEAVSMKVAPVAVIDQSSDDISNELTILQAADEKEQKVTVDADDSTVDDAIDQNKENPNQLQIEEGETVDKNDVESKGKCLEITY